MRRKRDELPERASHEKMKAFTMQNANSPRLDALPLGAVSVVDGRLAKGDYFRQDNAAVAHSEQRVL